MSIPPAVRREAARVIDNLEYYQLMPPTVTVTFHAHTVDGHEMTMLFKDADVELLDVGTERLLLNSRPRDGIAFDRAEFAAWFDLEMTSDHSDAFVREVDADGDTRYTHGDIVELDVQALVS